MSLKNPITTPDRLAAYRRACERWKRHWKEAVLIWESNRVRQGPEPTPESAKPEKCEPKDYGLTEADQFWANKIYQEVFKR